MKDQKENNNENKTTSTPLMQAQEIGVLQKEKQKGLFGVIVFFAILIGVTVGLPNIQKYIEEKNNPVVENNQNEDKDKNKEDLNSEEELVYYEIDNNSEFTFNNNLKFNNLSKESAEDYYLSVTIQNISNNTINLNNDYYFELFNGEKTLLERVKLVSDKSLGSNQSVILKLLINEDSYKNATLLTIDNKTEEDYQEVILSAKENDYDVLACSNNERNIKYYFKDNKLAKISDIIEYENEDENLYNEKVKEYTLQASNLNNIEGVSSNLIDTTTAFTMNTQIDLTIANVKDLNSSYYFVKDTDPKVVKFELEAQRYLCQ